MRKLNIFFAFVLIVLALPSTLAVASFSITSFSCTPSEVKTNQVFSCTAQIMNSGDAAGSVSIVTLYPDSNDWLEESSYQQASGTSVDPGQSSEVTFSGLRATKSGSNEFARIMLDNVADTYVADNSISVNTIDVAVVASSSASSAAMSGSFTVSGTVTAGGSIDVLLTMGISSGGCSLGNQDAQKTITNMQNGNQQTRSWTVTQGTTGACVYTLTASATGDGGVATDSDSAPASVTCTDCPVSDSGSGSGSGSCAGGGGGCGTGTVVSPLGELTIETTNEIAKSAAVSFSVAGSAHKLTVMNLTETKATLKFESTPQTVVVGVGEETRIDLDGNGKNDLIVRVKSINILLWKVTLILTPLPDGIDKTAVADANKSAGAEDKKSGDGLGIGGLGDILNGSNLKNVLYMVGLGILAIVVILGIAWLIKWLMAKVGKGLKGKINVLQGKDIVVK